MTKLKRLSFPWSRRKKEFKFITLPRGAHKKTMCLPLMVVLRDELKIAQNGMEAKKAIKAGKVLVDGRICKDHKRGIGLFDTVSLPDAKMGARLVSKKGLKIITIPEEEAKLKLCKIKDKKAVCGGKIQLNLHDGRNIILDNNNYSTYDSILISLPDQKVQDHVKFEEGAMVLVTSGSQSGRVSKIKKIERGLNRRIWLEEDGQTYEAPFDGVIVVGKNKSLITIGE